VNATLRTPPQDLKAEMALLGCMILSDKEIDIATETVEVQHFYSDVFAKVFTTLVAMRQAGEKIDAITLSNALEKSGDLEDIGGPDRLFELMEAVPYVSHCEYYAKIVKDRWRRRVAQQVGQKLIEMADDLTTDTDDALGAAETMLHAAIAGGSRISMKHVSEVVDGVVHSVDNPDLTPRVKTGLADLDKLTRGVKRGQQVIIAARPSIGKTALALCVGMNMAMAEDGILVVSYEMPASEMGERLMSIHSGISVDEFPVWRNTIGDAATAIRKMPIYIDDSQPGINQLIAMIRLAARKGVKTVFVDYLQLIPPEDPKMLREQQVAASSRKLKNVALSCGITSIVLSQLNRASETRDGGRPRLSDLRESGAIEQDADQVWLLSRPNKEEPGNDNIATIDIAKHRSGPCGSVTLAWHGPTAKFSSNDSRPEVDFSNSR
jgi:replicative DNA helicase